ncbi:restriction endonuclease [Roseobacteraceae bacterium NS-SX3]
MPSDRRFTIEPEGLPDLPGMMLATLDALRQLGGSGSIQEIDETVIEIEGVSEAEQAIPMPNNEQRLKVNYYLAWARTYLRRGGAVENSARGVWAITEVGSAIHDRTPVATIVEVVQAEEREKARLKRKAKEAAEDAPDSPEVAITDADAGPVDEEDWKTALLSVLGSMAPDAFERLSQRLLREAGFTKVEVRGKTGDGGIDGLGVLRDLVTFKSILTARVEAGTHRFWHGDEHHSRGGYESVYREDDACKLADAVAELALLSDMTLATLSAAGAVRQVGTLIDS